MRLGEYRSKLKDKDDKLLVRLSLYESIELNDEGYVDLEIDICNENELYLRVIQ